MSDMVKLYIDGKEIWAKNGANLLKTARENGIDIPGLCYYEKVSPSGDCRLCVVKIEGRPGLVPSCLCTVEEGMKVTAFDEELESKRKVLVELILSEHNDDCINCIKDGDCELQDLAFRYGIETGQRKYPSFWREIEQFKDEGAPVLIYDSTKCIKCGRCIKACYEIQGKGVLSFSNRGIETHIIAGLADWNGSECDGCGECVQACPVGAIVEKPVYGIRVREKDPDKKVVTTCAYCGVGCQLNLWVKDNKIVKVMGADLIPNYGAACVKGRFGLDFVSRDDRLKRPLIKKNGKFEETSWDEALDYIAKKFMKIKNENGPDSLAGLSSARCTNEENFVFQKFMRAVIGTNNVDHCARLCHASTVVGLASTFGSGAMTNSIEELEYADVILVTGSNTTETHPVIATRIKRAVLFHGAKLIVVDPRKIDLCKYATVWMRQKNGTDVAWMNGMMNVIINEGLEDKEFIKSRTEDYEGFKKMVAKFTPEKVEKTGYMQKQMLQVLFIQWALLNIQLERIMYVQLLI